MRSLFYVMLSQISLALDSSGVYTPVVVSSVTVPQYGVQGKHAVLYCSYRSVQPVYSVRWYKNGKEFFSYLPGKSEPISVHDLPGITVDIGKSSIYQVTLNHLTLGSTGRYRCEVSEEGPMFATDSSFGDMLVVVVPLDGPKILGAESRYSVGEKMAINCSSEATLPPANLTWYINQQPVTSAHLVQYPVVNISYNHEDILHTNTVGLLHTVRRHDFQHMNHKQMKIKCVASIFDAYYKVVEIVVGKSRRRKIVKVSNRNKNKYTYLTKNSEADNSGQLNSPSNPTSSSFVNSCYKISIPTFLLFSLLGSHL